MKLLMIFSWKIFPLIREYARHGTHTAAIICRTAENEETGFASEIKLCAVSVPRGGKILLNLVLGMDALLDCDIKIACMPVGVLQKTPVFIRMIEAFYKKGILVIAPAGNRGKGNLHSPGLYPSMLTVGASDQNGNPAKFSGSCTEKNGNCIKPDIMAPGVNILSAVPGGKRKTRSGTSTSCAYIAGIAAKLLAAKPNASPDQIKNALMATAESLPQHHRDRCKTGIIRPDSALKYLLTGKKESFAFDIPLFLKQKYIDPRFADRYERAKPDEKIESLIIAQSDENEQKKDLTKRLIEQSAEQSGTMPAKVRYFKNADLAYIEAKRAFYTELLEQAELFVCSATDINPSLRCLRHFSDVYGTTNLFLCKINVL
jgi:hypothetical protein